MMIYTNPKVLLGWAGWHERPAAKRVIVRIPPIQMMGILNVRNPCAQGCMTQLKA